MGKTGRKNKTYSPEFKISVILDMRKNHLGYKETMRKYFPHLESRSFKFLKKWERIFLEEGAEGLMKERRGRACSADGTGKGRSPTSDKKVEEDLTAENQRLRMENEYLKKTELLSSCEKAKEREKALLIAALRKKYPLKDLLQLSGLARSTFYYYLKHINKDKYEREKQEIVDIFNINKGRYGYRRIVTVLHNRGYSINHKTVLKLMNGLGLKGKQSKNGNYHSYKGAVGRTADNLLQRDFHANKPFERLTTDITVFQVCNEKVYLSPVLDLFNREIISYSISLSPDLQQIRDMLHGLFHKLPDKATPILHSDQGWQYQHAEYQRLLAKHHITQSMSRKGNCMDNGAMENFFGRLKVEMFYGEKFESVNIFIEELKKYIDYYNNERIVSKWKMSPVQFRTHFPAS